MSYVQYPNIQDENTHGDHGEEYFRAETLAKAIEHARAWAWEIDEVGTWEWKLYDQSEEEASGQAEKVYTGRVTVTP